MLDLRKRPFAFKAQKYYLMCFGQEAESESRIESCMHAGLFAFCWFSSTNATD